MTHHPNTPASRTEQAAPSVASGASETMDLAHELYAMAQGPQPVEDAVQAIAQRLSSGPTTSVLEALRWTAAALQAVIDSRGESGSISMIVSGEKKSLEEVLDMADTALAAPGAAIEQEDHSTPGQWFVRKRERDGELLDCFVAAPDFLGLPYDAEILGDDEYRDGKNDDQEDGSGIRRKLADCELIVKAVTFYRAALASRQEAPAASASPATVAQPVVWQYRVQPNWKSATGWSDWQECSAEVAQDYIRVPSLHDWNYQVRALYEAAQPCPSQGCVLSDAQCREIYWELDKFGKEMDHYEYGLPLLQIDDREEQVFKIIRDAALSTDKGDGGSKE